MARGRAAGLLSRLASANANLWSRRKSVSRKLTTLDRLCAVYGPLPRRRESVGVVSGTFDLIHPGHVRLFVAAKQMVDVLIVLTMSTAAIRQQEKNQLGDRPIYNSRDRIEVLSALRPVDHVVMLDDLDCLAALLAFCPDYFIKSAHDRSRAVVQAEAALVEDLGGEAIFLAAQPSDVFIYGNHPAYQTASGDARGRFAGCIIAAAHNEWR